MVCAVEAGQEDSTAMCKVAALIEREAAAVPILVKTAGEDKKTVPRMPGWQLADVVDISCIDNWQGHGCRTVRVVTVATDLFPNPRA